jgi:hypothetical protein
VNLVPNLVFTTNSEFAMNAKPNHILALIKTPANSRREKSSNRLAMKPYLTPYAPIVLPSG